MEIEKAISAQTSPPGPNSARLPPLTGVPRLSAPDCPALSSPSRSLPSGAKLSALVSSPALPSSLSASQARFASRRAIALCARPLSLSTSWASPVSFALPAPAVDQRARTRARRRNSWPRHPNSLFEPRMCPHSLPRLISCSLAPAHALPTLSYLAGDPRPPPRSSSSPEATPSDPELRPEVRHPPPCLFYSIRAYP
jgi:hypothetical protein